MSDHHLAPQQQKPLPRRGARLPRIQARIIDILVEMWPGCFVPMRAPIKKPLKLGIGEDILLQLPELGARLVATALEDYTYEANYARAIVAGADRFDLDGKPCGKVTVREQDHAAWRLRKLAYLKKRNRPYGDRP
jgi:ProP effector